MSSVLTAWLMIGGVWYHGSVLHGWWPFNMGTQDKCEQAIEYIAENGLLAAPTGTTEVHFTCETPDDSFIQIQEKHIPVEDPRE